MKRTILLLLALTLMLGALSSCILGDNQPKTVAEYLRWHFTNPDQTNISLAADVTETFHTWRLDTESYVSPNGTRFSISKNNIMVQTHSGNMFIINKTTSVNYAATYADPGNGDRVFLYADNTRAFLEAPGTPDNTYLNVYSYTDGLLFVLDEPLFVFLSADKEDVYVSEDGSNSFTFYGGKTYTLTDTTEIDKFKAEDFYHIPAETLPDFGNTLNLAYSKVNANTDGCYFSALVPYVTPKEVVRIMEQNGYSLYQSDTYGLFAVNGEDVVYEGTDADNTVCVKISYVPKIADLAEEPDNYGTNILIFDYRYRSAYYQMDLNEKSSWTTYQAGVLSDIGVTLPFTQFGDLLTVSAYKGGTDSHSHDLLAHVDAYTVKDEYYKPLLTDYGQKLVDAGFTKYVPPVDENSAPEDVENWKNSADAVYHNCYVSQTYGVAVKFGWDITNGNKIFIYTLADLQAVANGTYE